MLVYCNGCPIKPTATTLNPEVEMDRTDGIKMCEKNHNRGSQQKLTAKNREGKRSQVDNANGEKRESSGEGLIGQRQTERQDLPLSFQRERKQTASAERMRQSQGRLGKKV